MLRLATVAAMSFWSAIAVASEPAPDAASNVIAVPALPMPAAAPAVKSKVICHTDYAIGSWVQRVRRCGTANQWGLADRALRQAAHEKFDVERLGLPQ